MKLANLTRWRSAYNPIWKGGSDTVKGIIKEAVIENLNTEEIKVIRIADLGCSIGPNTFFSVQNLIHWLSKPPQGVLNEGRIYYAGASEDVVRAYSDQFITDLHDFMSARADEIVTGGLMFLVLPGTPNDHSDSNISVIFDFLGSSFMDLVHQGVVEKSAVDAFNMPIYVPRLGGMRNVIEKNGCFSIERMELTNPRSKLGQEPVDAALVIKHMRAILEGILTSHFGNSVVDKTFDNACAKTQELSRFLNGHRYTSRDQMFVVLKRK